MFLESVEGLPGFVIGAKFLRRFFAFDRRAESVRNVAQVAEGAREVTVEHFGIEVGRFAAANGAQEVCEMALSAAERFDRLMLEVERDAARVTRHHDVAV